MGKRLIIQGADFSEVAIEKEPIYKFLYNNADWSQTANVQNHSGHYAEGIALGQYDWVAPAGKKIVGVKLSISNVRNGFIDFVVVRGFRQNGVIDANKVSYDNICEKQTITVEKTGVQVFMLPTPVVLTENDWVGFGNFTDASSKIAQPYLDDAFNGCFVWSPYDSTNANKYMDCTNVGYRSAIYDLLYEVE